MNGPGTHSQVDSANVLFGFASNAPRSARNERFQGLILVAERFVFQRIVWSSDGPSVRRTADRHIPICDAAFTGRLGRHCQLDAGRNLGRIIERKRHVPKPPFQLKKGSPQFTSTHEWRSAVDQNGISANYRGR
jgi:hypothetical protein